MCSGETSDKCPDLKVTWVSRIKKTATLDLLHWLLSMMNSATAVLNQWSTLSACVWEEVRALLSTQSARGLDGKSYRWTCSAFMQCELGNTTCKTTWFAYSAPYTYSRLKESITLFCNKRDSNGIRKHRWCYLEVLLPLTVFAHWLSASLSADLENDRKQMQCRAELPKGWQQLWLLWPFIKNHTLAVWPFSHMIGIPPWPQPEVTGGYFRVMHLTITPVHKTCNNMSLTEL